MGAPAIVAVGSGPEGLDAAEPQLRERYAQRYRIECSRDPERGLALLEAMADDGVDLALLLVTPVALRATDWALLDRVRRRHPQAKRALLVPPNAWTNEATAGAIRTAMALGRVDHFVYEPRPPSDEVFHEAVGSFLLEWAREKRLVPQTVQIVGEDWSGRAYELRAVFENCSVPHAFCLAASARGRELLAEAGPDARLPLMVLPDGRALSDPSNAEIAAAAGAPAGTGRPSVRPARRRRRPGRAVRSGLRCVRGPAGAGRRRGRDRRAGPIELPDPQLPRLCQGRQRKPSRRAGV